VQLEALESTWRVVSCMLLLERMHTAAGGPSWQQSVLRCQRLRKIRSKYREAQQRQNR
jgi:hypothetical protein